MWLTTLSCCVICNYIFVTSEAITAIADNETESPLIQTQDLIDFPIYFETPNVTLKTKHIQSRLKWIASKWQVSNETDNFQVINANEMENLISDFEFKSLPLKKDSEMSVDLPPNVHLIRVTIFAKNSFPLAYFFLRNKNNTCTLVYSYKGVKLQSCGELQGFKINCDTYKWNKMDTTIEQRLIEESAFASFSAIDYEYLFSKNISSDRTSINIGEMECVSMFLSIDRGSHLEIFLDGTISKTMYGFNRINQLKLWKFVKIPTRGAKIMSIKRFVDSVETEHFWAIKNIQPCNLEHTAKYGDEKSILKEKCKNSHQNKNVCEDIVGPSYPHCEGHKICNGTDCHCGWNFKGTNCRERCDNLHFGVNCREEYPVVLHPPKIHSIHNNEVNVFFDLKYNETASKPTFFQIQYKEIDENLTSSFKNYTQPVEFPITSTHLETMHLNRTKEKYEIRAILYNSYNETASKAKIATLTTSTATLKITADNNSLENTVISWNLPRLYTDFLMYKCDFLFCHKTTENVKVIFFQRAGKINFNGFENCTVTLFDGTLILDQVEYKRSINLSIEKNELPKNVELYKDGIYLEFNECEQFKGAISYSIMYRCISNRCSNKNQRSLNLKLTTHSESVIKVDNMEVAQYEVNITASRSGQEPYIVHQVVQTKNGVFQLIRNLSLYAIDDKNLWIKWTTPNSFIGEIEDFRIIAITRNNVSSIINSWFRCTLWDRFFCANIRKPDVDSISVINVNGKIFNTTESGNPVSLNVNKIETSTRASENVQIKLTNSETFEILLQWQHPSYTYGSISAFDIRIEDENNENRIITKRIGEYKRKYNQSISISEQTKFNISVSAANVTSESSFITVFPCFYNNSKILFLLYQFKSDKYLTFLKNDYGFLMNQDYEMNYTSCCMNDDNIVCGISPNLQIEKLVESFVSHQWRTTTSTTVRVETHSSSTTVSTDDNVYSTSFIEETTSVDLTQDNVTYVMKSNFGNLYTIALCGLIVIILCTLFSTLTYFWCKRGSNTSAKNADSVEDHELLARFSEETVPLQQTEVEAISGIDGSMKIETRCLESYVKEMVGRKELIMQFHSLPKKIHHSTNDAFRSKNKNKNKNIDHIPYDYNRVVLSPLEGVGKDDYINASYVEVEGSERGCYIATQGPKFCTIRDFWRMIWQEQVETIVMATNFMENKERKCAEYFPTSQGATFECGSFFIKLLNTERCEFYTIRYFEIKYEGAKKQVRHFQLSWNPDDGRPMYPNILVPLVKKIDSIRKESWAPTVFHCSTGVNRTGTLILCNLALQMAEEEKSVDFYNLLRLLRHQRPYMIISEKQYILTHLVVLECLMEEEAVFKKSIKENFDSAVLKQQLLFLDRLKWHDEIVDSWRKPKRNTIVSSSFHFFKVDGYKFPEKYLVVETPDKSSVSSFWNCVIKENIKYIVLFQKNTHKMWPFEERNFRTRVSVQVQDTVETSYSTIIDLKIMVFDLSGSTMMFGKIIHCFQSKFVSFLESKNVNQLLSLVDDINIICQHNDVKRILVACSDGIISSGLFVTLSYVVNKCQEEGEVDVCNALRTVRRSGANFIKNIDQLKFLYNAIFEYLLKFDKYSHIL